MRHLRWIVPAVIGVVLFVVPLAVAVRLNSGPEMSSDESLLFLGMGIVWFVGPLVCLIVTIVQAVTVQAETRRRRAWQQEQQTLGQTPEGIAHWRRVAADLRAQLLAGQAPPSVAVWPVTLRPGENACYDVILRYARFYGTDVSYQHGSTFAFGRPGFVAAAVAATAIGNHRRRAAAQRMAAAQWRETQLTRVVVTDQRVVCDLGGRWLTFDYTAMSAVWPDVSGDAFVAAFHATEPLLLDGPASDVVSVLALAALHGPQGLREHPGLRELDVVGSAPELDPGPEAAGGRGGGRPAGPRDGQGGTHPSIFDA
ncbi:hypothetical protein DT076_14380 [Desertihabitans brevis]|uniref:Uncharacterized protein n=1 Tax=Desertihabitans brevis TaxID=2268447 RepID=A0A367YS97_9ACTN|nr:hypothetical protein [Desertihabitans brevis]RCK68765.1 hypothetical protein DT076_14380 [Desertihabitans brevis]